MSIRKEFIALIDQDKNKFKKELGSILENLILDKMATMYINESMIVFKKIVIQKQIQIQEEIIPEKTKKLFPLKEINDAIITERIHWMIAKDGSDIEIDPKLAKYLAELYNSLNTLHKEKLLKLISESKNGYKKAVNMAVKLYRR